MVHGGSQKVLRDVMIGLGIRGHEITILCPRREDNKDIFWLSNRVKVEPILLLKGTFPAPYEVSPFRLLQTCYRIQEKLPDFDGGCKKFCVHRNLSFPDKSSICKILLSIFLIFCCRWFFLFIV